MKEDLKWSQRVPPFVKQLLAVSGVVLYMIGTGANIAFPGVLLQQLRMPDSAVRLTEEHESWIASLLGLALISGIVVAPIFMQRLGRRLTNQISTLPAMLGWALMAAAKEPWTLLTSRLLQFPGKIGSPYLFPWVAYKATKRVYQGMGSSIHLDNRGFAMGLEAAAAPVSIAEYSDPRHRGAFLATIAFSFACGMLVAHILGILLYWRTAALACGSVYGVSLLLISVSPETPPYLASKGRYAQCRKAFQWLRGTDQTSAAELEILLNSQKNRVSIDPGVSRWRNYRQTVKKPEFYKPTLIMMFMFVLFQVSGMTVIPSYTVPIMEEVTDKAIEPITAMLMVDSVRFVTGILACIVVNKFARRTVLFSGIIITVVSLFLTSILLYLRDFGYIHEEFKWIPVVPTLFYMFGKTIGILPIPWAIAGEIFPLAYRSLGSGISGMFLSIMFFLVVKTAPTCFKEMGVNGTFIAYGVLVFICGVFLYFLLPETRGKTLYEIECHFKGISADLDKVTSESDKMLELKELEGG